MLISKTLKTAVLAALIGVAGAASIAPASAHESDRRDGYRRDGGDRRDFGSDHRFRHDRFGHGWRHHHRFHRGWY
ncbi:MAG TPA: hypothetical protein VGB91_06180 [Rhizomicrobium sp.]